MDEKQSRMKKLETTHKEFMNVIIACEENNDFDMIEKRQDYIDDAKSVVNKNKILSIAYAVNYIIEHHKDECHECGKPMIDYIHSDRL